MSRFKSSLFLVHRETGQRYPIKADVIIGRTIGDIVFAQDMQLSPKHCLVKPDGKYLTVLDLHTTNGTTINGKRISPENEHRLGPGADLAFGEQVFTLQSISVSRKVVRKSKRKRLEPSFLTLYAVLLANMAVFAWCVLRGMPWLAPKPDHLLATGAALTTAATAGQWWRLVSSMFLHYGILHLACNLWALFVLGEFAVGGAGDAGFLLLFLFSGAAAGIVNLLLGAPTMVAAGASAGVFGIVGAMVALMLTGRMKVKRVGVHAALAALACFLDSVLFARGQIFPQAHAAAMVTGFFTLFAIDITGSETSFAKQLQLAVSMVVALAIACMYVPRKPAASQLSPVEAVQREVQDVYENFTAIRTSLERQTTMPKTVAARIKNQILPHLEELAAQVPTVPAENENQRRILDLETRFITAFQVQAKAFAQLAETGEAHFQDDVDISYEQLEQIRVEYAQKTDPKRDAVGLPMPLQSPFQIVEHEMRHALRDYRALGAAVQSHQITDPQMVENIRNDLMPKLKAVGARMGVIVAQGESEKRRLALDQKLVAAYLEQVKNIASFAETKAPGFNKGVEKWGAVIDTLDAELNKVNEPRAPAGQAVPRK